jgi:hypothetical protein
MPCSPTASLTMHREMAPSFSLKKLAQKFQDLVPLAVSRYFSGLDRGAMDTPKVTPFPATSQAMAGLPPAQEDSKKSH